MELAVGDWTEIQVPIKNASSNQLTGLLTLDVPKGLEAEVYALSNTTNVKHMVHVGFNTWMFTAEGGSSYATAINGTSGDMLHIVISVDDDAVPGYYNISGLIQQVSY